MKRSRSNYIGAAALALLISAPFFFSAPYVINPSWLEQNRLLAGIAGGAIAITAYLISDHIAMLWHHRRRPPSG